MPSAIKTRWSERRVSRVTDRRQAARGGRRCTDYGWSAPPPLVACAACATGMAGLLELSDASALSMATYRCEACGHQFKRVTEP